MFTGLGKRGLEGERAEMGRKRTEATIKRDSAMTRAQSQRGTAQVKSAQKTHETTTKEKKNETNQPLEDAHPRLRRKKGEGTKGCSIDCLRWTQGVDRGRGNEDPL